LRQLGKRSWQESLGRSGLIGFALGLALLLWLPIGLLGAPLDTPDGLIHLGWAASWAQQIRGGWWWPLWSDLNWAGAGSAALQLYPPLFRLMAGIPIALGIPPARALELALLLLLVLNNLGAACLARLWLQPGRWPWVLVALAALNPYLFVNVTIRGAWPEAMGQLLLWWLALGWLGLERRRRWGLPVATLALAGILLSNWNSAQLSLLAWGLGLAVLIRPHPNWRAMRRWCLVPVGAIAITAAFWGPALAAMGQVRPPIPNYLFTYEFLFAHHPGRIVLADLLWIQAAVILVLGLVRWLGWGWRGLAWDGAGDLGSTEDTSYGSHGNQEGAYLASWGLLLACFGIWMMLPISEPIYQLLVPLQRIQFPWRWLGPTWFGALLWLSSPGALPIGTDQPRSVLRRGAWLGAITLAAVLWVDSLSRFRNNILGHHPSELERRSLNRLLACDPLVPCPDGVNALPPTGELSKRFLALGDGRIALTGVPDYSPAGIPESSWVRRMQTFWVPAWPQQTWVAFLGEGAPERAGQGSRPGSADLVDHGPTQRLIRVEAPTPGRLRVMQWAYPAWTVQKRRVGATNWGNPLPFSGPNQARDQEGWISVPLAAGTWEVALTYGSRR
jgi:hypothetical protein